MIFPKTQILRKRQRFVFCFVCFLFCCVCFVFFFFFSLDTFYSQTQQDNDVFLYVGHSGGEQFFNNRRVENLSINSAVLLMGCSSAAPRVEGEYCPNGISLSYLSAGAPCVVGNLWSITDVDGDSYTAEMLSLWFGGEGYEEEMTIAHAVAEAREVCQLSFSVGAAPVCVGFPVGIRSTS